MKKQLKEFRNDQSQSLDAVASVLSASFGRLHRVGGSTRVYLVGDQRAAIYTVGNSTSAVALVWNANTPKTVSSIYTWQDFNLDVEPDYQLDIPEGVDFSRISKQVVSMLKLGTIGGVSV